MNDRMDPSSFVKADVSLSGQLWFPISIFGAIMMFSLVGLLLNFALDSALILPAAMFSTIFFILFISKSSAVITRKRVIFRTKFGFTKHAYQIDWSEVNRILFDGCNFAFQGDGKQLVISASLASRKQRSHLNFSIATIALEQHIDIELAPLNGPHGRYIDRRQIDTEVGSQEGD